MENRKVDIREALGKLQKLVTSSLLPRELYLIHKKANHAGHRECIVLGLNATVAEMCTSGSHGSYFTMDENGRIYEQHFVQGAEEHDYGECNEITKEEYLARIEALPYENMANINLFLGTFEKYFQE